MITASTMLSMSSKYIVNLDFIKFVNKKIIPSFGFLLIELQLKDKITKDKTKDIELLPYKHQVMLKDSLVFVV